VVGDPDDRELTRIQTLVLVKAWPEAGLRQRQAEYVERCAQYSQLVRWDSHLICSRDAGRLLCGNHRPFSCSRPSPPESFADLVGKREQAWPSTRKPD
jgi:hypothetical protein